jgi:hypothetical protein
VGETRPSQADPRGSRQEPSKGKGRNSRWGVLAADQACAPHNWDPFTLSGIYSGYLHYPFREGACASRLQALPARRAFAIHSHLSLFPLISFTHTFRRMTRMDSVTRCGDCSEGLIDWFRLGQPVRLPLRPDFTPHRRTFQAIPLSAAQCKARPWALVEQVASPIPRLPTNGWRSMQC